MSKSRKTALTELLCTVHGQVCILMKRPDPARDGDPRWSLPKKELCFCQGVVAPAMFKSCPTMEETYSEEDLWFIDDPRELTLRHNWKKDILDELLKRTEYCGKIILYRHLPAPILCRSIVIVIVGFKGTFHNSIISLNKFTRIVYNCKRLEDNI